MGEVSYLVFVAPALLASAAVTVAAEESTYPVMMSFKWNPIFYAMNAAPISGNQIASGVIIGMLVRMLPTCVVYFVVMLFFGAVPGPFGFLAVLVPVATRAWRSVCSSCPTPPRSKRTKARWR